MFKGHYILNPWFGGERRFNLSQILYIAPAASGKTSLIISEIKRRASQDPLARILVILPSHLQRQSFLKRLLSDNLTGIIGLELRLFDAVYEDILEKAGIIQQSLENASRYRLLHTILSRLKRDDKLKYYGSIAHKPGFIGALSSFILELKQGRVFPERFKEVALRRREKDRELASIYELYQQFLIEKGLVDREGKGWLAIQSLEEREDIYSDLTLLAVDGFDQFNPNQLYLLKLLSERAKDTMITLTYDGDRLAHSRFNRTYKDIISELELSPPQVVPLSSRSNNQHPALAHLEARLFELSDRDDKCKAGDSVYILEAPNRYREVKEALREMKKLLLEGIPPEEIAIISRELEGYVDLLENIALEYKLPIYISKRKLLNDNPLIKKLLLLLSLSEEEFPRRWILEILHSPYFDLSDFGFGENDIYLLDKISREQGIIKGRENWLRILEELAEAGSSLGKEDDEEEGKADYIEEVARLKGILERFFDFVTPDSRESDSYAEFNSFIMQILGEYSLKVREQLSLGNRRSSLPQSLDIEESRLYKRDLAAFEAFKSIIDSMVRASELIDPRQVSYQEFLDELKANISSSEYQVNELREGKVIIQDVYQARGLPYSYVFLLGLAEGEFPKTLQEDVIYSDKEREELIEEGLNLEMKLASVENSIFYEAITRGRKRLYLSRFYLDEEGNDLPPSPYLEEVEKHLEINHRNHYRLGSVPIPDDSGSPNELSVSVAEGMSDNREGIWPFYNGLLFYPPWRTVIRGRKIEIVRESRRMNNIYEGIFEEEKLKEELKRRFGEGYHWSVSSLNRYGSCPFRFFAHRLLGLESLEEPEEGIDVLQIGSLNHQILKETYLCFIEEGIRIGSDNLSQVKEILGEVANAVLDEAPRRYGFPATPLWFQEREELLLRLERFLEREAESNDKDKEEYIPYMLEESFGFEGKPCLELRGERGKVLIRGYIDRIDLSADGNSCRVIDYKTGATHITTKEIEKGRNFQLPIYIWAVEKAICPEVKVEQAYFLHLKDRSRSGRLKRDSKRSDLLKKAEEHIYNYIEGVREGRFPIRPNEKCPIYCEFLSICRKNRYTSEKAEEGED